MDIKKEIARVESRLAENGEQISEFCRRAGIDRSTWTRWKSGTTTPNLKNWQRALDAVTLSEGEVA